MLNAVAYHALQPGPRLLVLGAVHGNEICGPQAIRQVISRFEDGGLVLQKGSVTFIPVCNPEAYRQNRRFIEHNLNRSLAPRPAPHLYEERIMNVLCPYLERCDYLLDIHSYSAGGPAFAFSGPSPHMEKEEPFIAAMGINDLLYGWSEAYHAAGVAQDARESVGTTEYARPFGAVATTLECGQHNDPANTGIAIRAIEGALGYCGLIAAPLHPPARVRRNRVIFAQFKEREGAFSRPLAHLQAVKKGDELARYADGTPLQAPCDARIIMPKPDAAVGIEWYFLAVDES